MTVSGNDWGIDLGGTRKSGLTSPWDSAPKRPEINGPPRYGAALQRRLKPPDGSGFDYTRRKFLFAVGLPEAVVGRPFVCRRVNTAECSDRFDTTILPAAGSPRHNRGNLLEVAVHLLPALFIEGK